MNTYLMKKALIETAVDQGIKSMEEDPKRNIRRLCDLGKQFSSNRFHEMIFSVMQELLNNENSAYYEMVHNLLTNSDHEALKKFGVNFGYMGWTHGAAIIREGEYAGGCCVPWAIMMRYNPECQEGLTIERIDQLVQKGQELGIYIYYIRESNTSHDESYALLEVLERYKECAFLWIKGDGRLTAAQIQMLKICKSTLVSLPVQDEETMLTVALLRDQGIPFSLYSEYSDEYVPSFVGNGKNLSLERVLSSQTAIYFVIAKDGTTFSAAKDAYNSRMEQKHPFLILDYYGDAIALSKILCEHHFLLEIDAEGHVLQPAEHAGEAFAFEKPLSEALSDILPPFTHK